MTDVTPHSGPIRTSVPDETQTERADSAMLTPNPLILLLDPDECDTSDKIHRIWASYARTQHYGYARAVRAGRLFPSFARLVFAMTGEDVVRCYDCESVVLADETEDYDGNPICESCREDYYDCDECGRTTHHDCATYVEGPDRTVCDSCMSRYYWCEHCETYSEGPCEECSTDCECCSARPTFRFPANGAGTIGNDERLTLTLPKGIISDAGIAAIQEAVVEHMPTAHAFRDAAERYYALNSSLLGPEGRTTRDAYFEASEAHSAVQRTVAKAVESVGHEWQGKRGNYPKRLSSALYKLGIKLEPATISEVGNLARQYSDDTSEYHIEFTRDLNQSAAYFYHEVSCWWQSYANSRCALKNWGGLAMRTFAEADSDQDDPSGRVFIFPLNEDFEPTQNAETAHAYMVFNAYGALGGYSSARIVAHLAGKTYRKVRFDLEIDNGYVNSNAGYLVCDAGTIGNAPDSFSFGGDTHRVAQ